MAGSIQKIPFLADNNVQVMVFSGDTDYVVSQLETHTVLIKKLNSALKGKWKPWFISNSQIGGYVAAYTPFLFVTIKGAGHMVPQWKRESAFHIFSKFLKNESWYN